MEIHQKIACQMLNRPWHEIPLELRNSLDKANARIRKTPDKCMCEGGGLYSRSVVATLIAQYESQTGISLD